MLGVSMIVGGLGGWFAFRPNPHHARIITLGDSEEYLALEPGSIIVLEFNKPVPTGIAQRRAELEIGVEAFPEFLSYWKDATALFGDVLTVSEKKVILKVEDFSVPTELSYRSLTGDWYKVKVYVLGDKDLDRFITRSRPLPRDGTVPIGQGTFGLRIRGVSLAESLQITVRDFMRRMSMRRMSAPAPPLVPQVLPNPYIDKVMGDVEAHGQWSRHGKVLRFRLTLRNHGKKPVKGLCLSDLKLGKQSPQGVQVPYAVPVIEPGKACELTFDFPNGDASGGLMIEWSYTISEDVRE